MQPSTGRRERITSALLTTTGQSTRVVTSLGREIAVARESITETDGRYSSIRAGAEERIYTGAETGIIKGQA